MASVGVVAAPAWVVLAITVVHPKEIVNAKMVAVERTVDEVSPISFESCLGCNVGIVVKVDSVRLRQSGRLIRGVLIIHKKLTRRYGIFTKIVLKIVALNLSLLHFKPLRWMPGERGAGR